MYFFNPRSFSDRDTILFAKITDLPRGDNMTYLASAIRLHMMRRDAID